MDSDVQVSNFLNVRPCPDHGGRVEASFAGVAIGTAKVKRSKSGSSGFSKMKEKNTTLCTLSPMFTHTPHPTIPFDAHPNEQSKGKNIRKIRRR